ncbi:hypothetical protein IWX75_002795 [Arthrobacter sp. CAN_A6]|uniref:hypothetical protein n=1 Tax=Arthrobacter sp. CAN_A6 TaxID=2787721 RepID=UPI001A27DBC5
MKASDASILKTRMENPHRAGPPELDGNGKRLVAYFGMVLASNPPGKREEMFKEIPPSVRPAYRLVGRRMYRRQYATLFPGRTLPDTL